MLRTDLVELINQGKAWAFVGSGASADAGAPTWRGLVLGTVARLDFGKLEELNADKRYQQALDAGRFAQCFARIEAIAGRNTLEQSVKEQLMSLARPGDILRRIADWPLAGYVTTNYDSLLKGSLLEIGQRGWLGIGNSAEEVRKVSGDATEILWHIHGAVDQSDRTSRLILTERDYDDLYLEGSPVVTQLRGLLSQRRVVFIGFGFQDPEVMRLLRLVGRFCNPARPAFAFLSDLDGNAHEGERLDLLEKYNVDVIPYQVVDGSHDQLLQLLDIYSSFLLRRTLRFGQPARPCPSYDPETTGLLVYNQLALRGQAKVADDVVGSLLKARVLSLLRYRGPSSRADIQSSLVERIRLVRAADTIEAAKASGAEAVEQCITELSQLGLVNISGDWTISLNETGLRLISDQAASAQRLSAQFTAGLNDRVREAFPIDSEARDRITLAAETFLKECIERRALGVAMSWNSPRQDFRQFHIVALLQALPQFMVQLKTPGEGLALIALIQDVLARPSEGESKYLGTALQAQFAVNLLGYAPETIQTRMKELSDSLFLIDSSTLIPLVAQSSVGHDTARLLLDRIGAVGSQAVTTALLATEVAEHARWAIDQIGLHALTPDAVSIATGRAGSRSNAFIEGFLAEMDRGHYPFDFQGYLRHVCGNTHGHVASDSAFSTAIQHLGIPCQALNDWSGFSEDIWAERQDRSEQIADLRRTKDTFRHERQVLAEAEALIIVERLRDGRFEFGGQRVADAYFVSHTRVIDIAAGAGVPITMRPDAILQWLSTVTACAPEELSSLVNGLLWELSARGLSVVDQSRIQQVFSPLISAARERLQEETASHRALIANQYGESGSRAFESVKDVDLPVAIKSLYVQRTLKLEEALEQERKAKEAALAQAKITEKQRKQLDAFEAREAQRKLKARSRNRAAASRKKGKKKKKR